MKTIPFHFSHGRSLLEAEKVVDELAVENDGNELLTESEKKLGNSIELASGDGQSRSQLLPGRIPQLGSRLSLGDKLQPPKPDLRQVASRGVAKIITAPSIVEIARQLNAESNNGQMETIIEEDNSFDLQPQPRV